MSRTSFMAAIAMGWLAHSAPASVTVTLDLLDAADGEFQPPGLIQVVDVLVDVSDEDVWTAAGPRITAANGAVIRYALDPNTNEPSILNPGADDPLVTSISRPRPRHGVARFNNAGAAWAGGYCPTAPSYTATLLELNVAWFASPPPSASSPSADGAIARIAIDPNSEWCFCCPFGVFRQGSVPPGSWITVSRFECVDSGSGVVSSSFDEPALVGDDWVLAFERGGTVSVCPWSVDSDLDIDLDDLALLLSSFGSCTGQPGFVLRADQNHSGCVDLADLAIILAHFGQPCC